MKITVNGTWTAANIADFVHIVETVSGFKGIRPLIENIAPDKRWSAVIDFAGVGVDELIKRYARATGKVVDISHPVLGFNSATYILTTPGKITLENALIPGGWSATFGNNIWLVITGNPVVLNSKWFWELWDYAGKASKCRYEAIVTPLISGVTQVQLQSPVEYLEDGSDKVISLVQEYLEDGGTPVRLKDAQRLVTVPPMTADYKISVLGGKLV